MISGDLRYSAPQGFVAEPLCIRFEGVEDLEDYLDEARATRPLLIKRPEDVLLSLSGLVQQRYQLTPWGLWSLCRRLSPNLGAVVADLAGLSSKQIGIKKFEPDIKTAVSVINTIIRSRFSHALEGARLIVDPVRKTIDGVVGSRYAYLSNTQLYESSSAFAKTVNGELISASLLGRRILLRYACPTPVFEANGRTYSLGWAFSNSETGQSAVRGGLLLVDEAHHSSMRSVFRKTHTKSLEEYFDDWLQQKMYEATSVFRPEALKRCFDHLAVAEIPCKPGSTKESAENLFTKLSKILPRSISRRVAQELYNPSSIQIDSTDWRAPGSPVPVLDRKSQHALYEALTNVAIECLPADQESAECLAYEFLRGRFDPFS